jgi:hypothetical protein
MATGEPVDQLPVELDAFDALVDGREITLSWSTLSETNNAGFSVEQRSAESGDWTAIGYVPGGGTTSNRASYHLTLANRIPGRYHFRLKQIDSDGGFVYSGAIEAVVRAESTLVVEAPWPNPADASASIVVSGSTSATVVVSLYDVVGRRVSTLYDAPLGPDQSREIRIDTASLPGGLYFVRAESGRDTRVTQLIVR